MSAVAHTPLPWKVLGLDGTTIIRDQGDVIGEVICEVEDTSAFVQKESRLSANAAFIVRACNNHDELLRLLKYAVEYSAAKHVFSDAFMDDAGADIAKASA